MLKLILLALFFGAIEGIFYDTYTGETISYEEVKKHDKANNTFWCTAEIEPCNPHEGRRLDGSCNNLQHPTRGASHTPFYRVLPAIYDKNFEPRLAKSGDKLPLSRRVRTSLLAEGHLPDLTFTQLATNFLVFLAGDIAAVHDTVNYVIWTTYCCEPRGKTDYMCTPNAIPDDDPVHRFSNIRCLNMTRPFSFQTAGCVKNNTTPERINSATPLIDLSVIYGSKQSKNDNKLRLFENGLLKFDVENGRVWPPGSRTGKHLCLLNEKPHETRCHNTPDDGTNSLLGINLLSIWFWRNHNRIASELARINRCWSDEKTFTIARDINIATALQIYFYELLPPFMGRENLIKDGVISSVEEFRDFYNENIIPQMSLEYPYVMRWIHLMQEGSLKMYDHKGYYVKQYPIVNLTLRTGFLAVDNNLDYLTQGSFRQASAKIDYIVDPEVSEVGLGPHQRASDITTNDLSKNRYFGFQPYIKYRDFCSGKQHNTFEDLEYLFEPERLELLRETYKDVEDMDLLAGIWMERDVEGGFVPPTFYCLVVEQLIRNLVSDRHWYERPNRPNAFTFEQLKEIRKATISRLLCDVGDTVIEIQPRGFERIGPYNRLCNCETIPSIDLSAWADPTCSNKNYGMRS